LDQIKGMEEESEKKN